MLCVSYAAAYTLENGDFRGLDMENIDHCNANKLTVQDCAEACMATQGCRYFSYRPAASAGDWCPNGCWLKTGKSTDFDPNSHVFGTLTTRKRAQAGWAGSAVKGPQSCAVS
jgi:hypothetical protein